MNKYINFVLSFLLASPQGLGYTWLVTGNTNRRKEMRMRKCRTCGKTKVVTEFNIYRGANDGLQFSCRDCQRIAAKDYREANKAKWANKDPYAEED